MDGATRIARILWMPVFLVVYYLLYDFQYKWYRSEAVSGMLSLWMVIVFGVVLSSLIFLRDQKLTWIFAFLAFLAPLALMYESTAPNYLILLSVAGVTGISYLLLPRKVSEIVRS